jgi:ferredoxin
MLAKVRFEPSGRTTLVERGTRLLDAARDVGLPMARACRADGLCGGCSVRVVEGAETLAAESALETRTKQRNRVSDAERLACCVRVHGDLVVTTSYW